MFSLTVPSSLSQKVISLLNAVFLLSCVCTLARSTIWNYKNSAWLCLTLCDSVWWIIENYIWFIYDVSIYNELIWLISWKVCLLVIVWRWATKTTRSGRVKTANEKSWLSRVKQFLCFHPPQVQWHVHAVDRWKSVNLGRLLVGIFNGEA